LFKHASSPIYDSNAWQTYFFFAVLAKENNPISLLFPEIQQVLEILEKSGIRAESVAIRHPI